MYVLRGRWPARTAEVRLQIYSNDTIPYNNTPQDEVSVTICAPGGAISSGRDRWTCNHQNRQRLGVQICSYGLTNRRHIGHWSRQSYASVQSARTAATVDKIGNQWPNSPPLIRVLDSAGQPESYCTYLTALYVVSHFTLADSLADRQ